MQDEGKYIDEWTIDSSNHIGSGTHGKVLGCYRTDNPDAYYCVKIIPKNNIAVRENELQKIIDNEKTVCQKLANVKCENLVQIFQVIDKPQNIYIIMEKCDHDLSKEFKNIKPNWFQWFEQIDMIQQIIKGGCALKDNKLIHRDIKPQNILVKIVTDEDQKQRKIYKLADFGLSRILENMYQKANLTLVGSLNYYAPEIFDQKKFSAKCDIYSYGLLFHQIAFNGLLPFNEDEGQIQHFERIKTSVFKCNSLKVKHGELITDLIEKMIVHSQEDRIGFEVLQEHQITKLKIEVSRASQYIPYDLRSGEIQVQEQENGILKEKMNKIYKIQNIYYRKFLLCQRVRDHLISKFSSLDQYLLSVIIFIGWIGFIQIKHAFSIIYSIFADLEESLVQQTDFLILFELLIQYVVQSKGDDKYQKINQTIQQTYHKFKSQLKDDHNELYKLIIKQQEQKINDYNILEKKLNLIISLEKKKINFQILCSELDDLMNIQIYPYNKIFDQKDLNLIKRVINLQQMFQIVDYQLIDVDQIFDPNSL